MSNKVCEFGYFFEDLLREAESNARGSWEESFVDEIRERFDEYGDDMFLSDKQEEVLKRIARW